MKRAIVLVDHGSEREEANRVVEHLAERLRASSRGEVYACHMELAEPNVDQAVDRAVAEGADTLFVIPFFLVPGRHSRADIPRLVSRAAGRHPGVRWHVDEPLGEDPAIAALIVDRVGRFDARVRDVPTPNW